MALMVDNSFSTNTSADRCAVKPMTFIPECPGLSIGSFLVLHSLGPVTTHSQHHSWFKFNVYTMCYYPVTLDTIDIVYPQLRDVFHFKLFASVFNLFRYNTKQNRISGLQTILFNTGRRKC